MALGLFKKGIKLAIKGGDVCATFGGAVADARVLFASESSLKERASAALSLTSEFISPVSVRDAKAGLRIAHLQQNRAAGKVGEQFLSDLLGGSSVYKKTSRGGRQIDNLAGAVAQESKVGRTSASSRILEQVAKDAELKNSPGSGVDSVELHFFHSNKTGKIGPNPRLRKAFDEAGIEIIIHDKKKLE